MCPSSIPDATCTSPTLESRQKLGHASSAPRISFSNSWTASAISACARRRFACSTFVRSAPSRPNVLIGDMYYWTRALANGGIVGCVNGHLADYFFYRPGTRTETNSNKVLAWTKESQALANFMCGRILADPTFSRTAAQVRKVRCRFLALTTSNQFAWNALRGASRGELFKSLVRSLPTMLGSWAAPARAIGAIVLPRKVLKWSMLLHARWLASRGVATGLQL